MKTLFITTLLLTAFTVSSPAQFKVLAESKKFHEPSYSAEIIQMKCGNTAMLSFSPSGIDVRIYGADHQEKVSTTVSSSVGLSMAAVEAAFEVKGDICYFISGLDGGNIPTLSRIIIDGNTGTLKATEHIAGYFEIIKKKAFNPLMNDLPDFIMERFSNFLNGYTKSINKMYKRKGGLFMDYMKRSKVNKESDFYSFMFYVHKNAVHHGYTSKIGEWKHDSYKILLSDTSTHVLRQEVFERFGGRQRFIDFHQQPVYRPIRS